MFWVHPTQHECFFYRALLHSVRGPKCFEGLKTVESVICQTFTDSCYARGLLENDTRWDATLFGEIVCQSSEHFRYLFSDLLKTCNVGNTSNLHKKYKDDLSEVFCNQEQFANPESEIYHTDKIYTRFLIEKEDSVAFARSTTSHIQVGRSN